MITLNELKRKIKNIEIGTDTLSVYAGAFNAAAEDLRKKGDTELAVKAQQYADAFRTLNDLDAAHPSDKDIETAYKKLSGFSEFMAGGKPGEPSNYTKIMASLPGFRQNLFEGSLSRLNEQFELGLDVEAVKAGDVRVDALEDAEEAEPQPMQVQEDRRTIAADELTDGTGLVTAARYIETIRDGGFPEKDPARLSEEQKDLALDRMLKIMAARELVDSDRGKKDKLVSNAVRPDDVKRRAEEMKNDLTFRKFLKALKEDPKKFKAAMSAATKRPGHGGGLDDMFKSFVKNQPACDLKNNAILKRYMPTVKERIEILQNQYKACIAADKEIQSIDAKLESIQKKRNSDDGTIKKLQAKRAELEDKAETYSPQKVGGEIIALRNLAKADRGKVASLEKPIPVAEEDTLCFDSNEVYDHTSEIFSDRKIHSLIAEGHGGKMMEKVRKEGNASLDPDYERGALKILDQNSIKTRMQEIVKEAEEVEGRLEVANLTGKQDKDLMDRSKLLLGEYLLLDGKTRNRQTGQIDESLLLNDVPHGEIETMKQNGPERNRTFSDLVGGVNQKQMQGIIRTLSYGEPDQLLTSLAEKKLDREKLITADPSIRSESAFSEKSDSISEFDDGAYEDSSVDIKLPNM